VAPAIQRLLVRAPNWVGDVVLSLPAVRDLRRNFAETRIEVLARPWVAELYRAVRRLTASARWPAFARIWPGSKVASTRQRS